MKRMLKIVLKGFLYLLVAGLVFVSWFRLKYEIIVHTRPLPENRWASPGYPLIRTVDPFIGTGGYPWTCAHNFPGATLPFSMVRLGPETASILTHKRALNTSGYFYGDNKICGFSHTRLIGTGATDGGHFLVTPAIGHISHNRLRKGFYIPFSHRDETAFPGYYSVYLRKKKILAEMTVTPHTGIHRYTFKGWREPHLVINAGNTLGDYTADNGHVAVLPEKQEVEGSIRTFGTFAQRYGGVTVYFVARFNKPFQSFTTWNEQGLFSGRDTISGHHPGVILDFAETIPDNRIVLKMGISYVSVDNARQNLNTEAGDKSFDEILETARQAWMKKLSLIDIEGATDTQRTIFYTALYRAFQMPTVFQDINGEYVGFDKKIHRTTGFRYFTDMSLWDTFRTLHPLFTLIAPADQHDMILSLLTMARQGGYLPRWPSGYGYTGSMLGSPADIVISEAWQKGLRDFDVEFAFHKMCLTALGPTRKGSGFPGRRGIVPYLKYHFCPADMMDKAVSKTLEYGWADDAIGRLAAALGKEDTAAIFFSHAHYYRNLWNPETRYFQPRNRDGKFVKEFRPRRLSYLDNSGKYTNDYVEGSALQWRWAVPYDPKGLISLFGDKRYFIRELNTFLAKQPKKLQPFFFGPYYWHGNEPDLHTAYLFNEAGRPDLTRKWVHWILEHKYDNTYVGLEGNDDGATLSAWYIFSTLGLYPIAGTDIYELGTPLFREATIRMNDHTLRMETENFIPGHYDVKQVLLNGKPLNRHYIRHKEIAKGGVLKFIMN